MVKEQNLALNPTKISGICGRLMCCMAYEHATYRELWEHLPNPGSKIRAPQATYIVVGVDIKARSVRICGQGVREFEIPVNEFQAFKECVLRGDEWISENSTEQGVTQPSSAVHEISRGQRAESRPSVSSRGKLKSIKERMPSEDVGKMSVTPIEGEPGKEPASCSECDVADGTPGKAKRSRRRRKKGPRQEEGKEHVVSSNEHREEKGVSHKENQTRENVPERKKHPIPAEHPQRKQGAEHMERSSGKTSSSPDKEGEQRQKARRRRRPKRKPNVVPPSEEAGGESSSHAPKDTQNKG